MSDGSDGSGTGAGGADATGHSGPTLPTPEAIPTPDGVCDDDDPTGYVVWHRKHLRVADHLALARAVADGDIVCPLFVVDPSFYGGDGLACDARIRFLHEAVASLDRRYGAAPGQTVERTALAARNRLRASTQIDPESTDPVAGPDGDPPDLDGGKSPGLTLGYGNPVDLLSAFVDRGWSVLTMATPTSRYGRRRDDRIRAACGDAVAFVSGDGLVRDEEHPRAEWQSHVEEWLAAPQHTPEWSESGPARLAVDAGVTPAAVDDGFGVAPTKTRVPTGSHRAAVARLREFVEGVRSYPGNISAPQDARGGTSGLSPHLNFGLLSVRQVHQHVTDEAPACRGRNMFTSRLVWNMHYNQKLADWPGWTERAVNPALENRDAERHDPGLVAAWKAGETGFPMVDAAMRCLRETGWLNFRMRAMCASVFAHVLAQPWRIGADWFHHHLIDSDAGVNYTQWQSQAGLVGKPSQRVYNPRKQVRDHDPDGEWICRWVPELADLPAEFLDRPERTPIAVQRNCGVRIGEDYPRPVVDFEARREAFWSRYERLRPAAARQLARPEVARRASFSGGYEAARAIAERYADAETDGRQVSLTDTVDGAAGTDGDARDSPADASDSAGVPSRGDAPDSSDGATRDADPRLPTGTGRAVGEPSPDDRAAASAAVGDGDGRADDEDDGPGDGQTTIGRFE